MAQVETRARRTLRRVGIVRANIAFLGQPDLTRMTSILAWYAQRYRISASEMTRARALANATVDDCAAALIRHLDALTTDASAIRGLNRVESESVNEHLRALAHDCTTFSVRQLLPPDTHHVLSDAVSRFTARGMGTGTFAGSAL